MSPRSVGLAAAMVFVACAADAQPPPSPKGQKTSFFNEEWLKTIVSIERDFGRPVSDPMCHGSICPLGTGFLVHTAESMILVTAAHVVRDKTTKQLAPGLQYRRTDTTTDAVVPDAALSNTQGNWIASEWVFSESNDLAARRFGWSDKAPPAVGFPESELLPAEAQSVGAPVLVLGFPAGLRTLDHQFPIARSGIIARREEHDLIIDAPAFPGNSGGPVVYVPPLRIQGDAVLRIDSPLVPVEKLVGVVTAYVPFYPKSVIGDVVAENSGLTIVVPASALGQLLSDKRLRSPQ